MHRTGLASPGGPGFLASPGGSSGGFYEIFCTRKNKGSEIVIMNQYSWTNKPLQVSRNRVFCERTSQKRPSSSRNVAAAAAVAEAAAAVQIEEGGYTT